MLGSLGKISPFDDGSGPGLLQRLAFAFCMVSMLGTWAAVLGIALLVK